MTRVVWNPTGGRFFETGLDRGVLYPTSGAGVPWSGLISVVEKSSSDGPVELYYDGVKYLGLPPNTDFEATLECFTYPDEFEPCDGVGEIMPGVMVTEQRRTEFGLTYRTRVGNDLQGIDYGYKLHLVYNGLATPNDKTWATTSDTQNPGSFTWDLTTTPEMIAGFRPSSHLVLDSNRVSPFGLAVLEGILYGTVDEDPRLPLPSEILTLPWNQRQVIVIAYPDTALLPRYAQDGDLVFVQSNRTLYSIGAPSGLTRDVFVIDGGDVSLVPSDAYPGDLIYDETTGKLYKLGE